jgi:hypothetical protein
LYTYFWCTFLQIFTPLKSWCPFIANKNIHIYFVSFTCVSISLQKYTWKHVRNQRTHHIACISVNICHTEMCLKQKLQFIMGIAFYFTWTLSCVRQNNDNSNTWVSCKVQLSLQNHCFRITTPNSIQICSADILILRPTHSSSTYWIVTSSLLSVQHFTLTTTPLPLRLHFFVQPWPFKEIHISKNCSLHILHFNSK